MARAETIQQQRTSEQFLWETVDVLRWNHDCGYENALQFSEMAKFDEHEESST